MGNSLWPNFESLTLDRPYFMLKISQSDKGKQISSSNRFSDTNLDLHSSTDHGPDPTQYGAPNMSNVT